MNNIISKDIDFIINSKCTDWEKFNNKTILITGATGFIGSFLIRSLLEYSIKNDKDIKVLALVRNKQRALDKYKSYYEMGLIKFIEQDICEEITSLEKADFVIHCASNAAPKEYASDPVGTINTNVAGTKNLLDYSKKVGVTKFLYVSTIEVYGATTVDEIKEEDYGYISSTNVRSCYNLSKKMSENLCICYAEQYGLDISIGRLSYIFGPGMKANDSKIVAVFPKMVANNQNIVMKSKGEQLRSYTYVADAITALLAILTKGEANKAYNISSELCKTTIRNIAETLVSIYPEKGLKVVFELPSNSEVKAFSFINNAVLDNTELKKLGWESKINLKDGLTNVLNEQILLGANANE